MGQSGSSPKTHFSVQVHSSDDYLTLDELHAWRPVPVGVAQVVDGAEALRCGHVYRQVAASRSGAGRLMGVRKRSSMFFVSDVTAAAETAAFAVEEHGLTDDQVIELAERLENAISDYFSEVRDA